MLSFNHRVMLIVVWTLVTQYSIFSLYITMFLNLDGTNGPIVVGRRGKRMRCRVTSAIIEEDGREFIKVESNGVPNYKPMIYDEDGDRSIIRGSWEEELRTATDGADGNPNYIGEHEHTFYIPRVPKGSGWQFSNKHELPLEAIGVALNGCLLYNSFTARRKTYAVESEKFDACCGHPDASSQYHYHQHPLCVTGNAALTNAPQKSVIEYINGLVASGEVSPVLGYMFDGVPITGPVSYNAGGEARILQPSYDHDVYMKGFGDLDYHNGILSPLVPGGKPTYHYVCTIQSSDEGITADTSNEGAIIPRFPYLIKSYRYVPDERNILD